MRSVNPHRSLINQMHHLKENEKHHISDEIRRRVGSSSIDSLLTYVRKRFISKKLQFFLLLGFK